MLAPLVAAGALLLAGCEGSSVTDQEAPPAAPATSSSPSPSAAAPASPAPIPGLRPLTAQQKQQRDYCQQGVVKNGCEFYTDDSLRLQGYDPDS